MNKKAIDKSISMAKLLKASISKGALWLYGNPEYEELTIEEIESMIRSNSFYKPNQGLDILDKKHLKWFLIMKKQKSYLSLITTVAVTSVILGILEQSQKKAEATARIEEMQDDNSKRTI